MRDAALLAVAHLGLRRAEIAGLTLTDLDLTGGTLIVRGKRNKVRALPIEGSIHQALADWRAVRGQASGPLFVAIHENGALLGGGLSS